MKKKIPTVRVFSTDLEIELAVDQEDGDFFVTDTGYTALVGVSREEIERRIAFLKDSCPGFSVATVTSITESGVSLNYLLTPTLVMKFLLLDNVDMAIKLGAVGVTSFIYNQAVEAQKKENEEDE